MKIKQDEKGKLVFTCVFLFIFVMINLYYPMQPYAGS